MILMLHIIVGVASLILGAGAMSARSRQLLRWQIGSFSMTILSGVALLILQPSALVHLCVSGVIFSTLSIALIVATRRRLAQPALG